MKKPLFLVFIVSACSAAAGFVGFSELFITYFPVHKELSNHYYKHPITKNVFFLEQGDWRKHDASKLEGVRLEDFKVLGRRHGRNGERFVYNEIQLSEVTVNQAILLTEESPHYIKDSENVFFLKRHPTQLIKLEGAHAPSFERIGDPKFLFARDKNKIYRKSVSLKLSKESVEVLANELLRNGDQLIFFPADQESGQIQKITLANPSLNSVGFGYFDGKTIYFIDYKQQKIVAVEVKNPESVRADGDAIVYDGTKLVPTASESLQEQ